MSGTIASTMRMHEESSRAVGQMQGQGIEFPDLPKLGIPEVPRDITDLGEEDLMVLFGELTAWGDYLCSQAACAQIDERTTQRILDQSEATALIAGWKGGSGERVAVAKASVALDPEVQNLREELDTRHAYRKLIEVMVSNVERDTALVSRELTRRTADPTRSRKKSWTA